MRECIGDEGMMSEAAAADERFSHSDYPEDGRRRGRAAYAAGLIDRAGSPPVFGDLRLSGLRSKSGCYAWKGRPDRPRALRSGSVVRSPMSHKASGGIDGALRVTAELRYGRNIHVGHNAVGDIMRQLVLKELPTRGCRAARTSRR